MEKDRIFAQKMSPVESFKFDERVVRVFDDMLVRSVPLYAESVRNQALLTERFYQNGTAVYDLGCSNGNLGRMILEEFSGRKLLMVAVDSSRAMIDKYGERLDGTERQSVRLVCDTVENISISQASVVIVNLTLQFLAPERRDDLVNEIYRGLVPGGILLLTEKTVHENAMFNRLQEDFYKNFKRENGYSELEISQKRDALEKVLIPETVEIHEKRIRKAGFDNFCVWLKWFNFVSMMAVKE